jgi:hypothetical protein
MNTLLDRLIDQLDTLVSFLALSREDVFLILNEHRVMWFSTNEKALPHAYTGYRKQVNHSAFLLGYSYFESFLTDLLAEILRNRPAMLPKAKKIDYSEIIENHDKGDLVGRIVRREIHELLYKNMADIIKELRSRYNLTVTEDEERELVVASLVRNCIMHNSSRADFRLGSHDGYQEGHEFEMSAVRVHQYGMTLRTMVRRMYEEARRNHDVGAEHTDAQNGESAGAPSLPVDLVVR